MPLDLATEGLLFDCGADDVVARTSERVIQSFGEALESRNAMAQWVGPGSTEKPGTRYGCVVAADSESWWS